MNNYTCSGVMIDTDYFCVSTGTYDNKALNTNINTLNLVKQQEDNKFYDRLLELSNKDVNNPYKNFGLNYEYNK